MKYVIEAWELLIARSPGTKIISFSYHHDPRMVPVPLKLKLSSSTPYVHALYLAFSTAFRYVTQRDQFGQQTPWHTQEQGTHTLQKRMEIERGTTKFIVFVVLIPVLVLLSGLFAGLTLGYMSLDETQLNVLSVSGTP